MIENEKELIAETKKGKENFFNNFVKSIEFNMKLKAIKGFETFNLIDLSKTYPEIFSEEMKGFDYESFEKKIRKYFKDKGIHSYINTSTKYIYPSNSEINFYERLKDINFAWGETQKKIEKDKEIRRINKEINDQIYNFINKVYAFDYSNKYYRYFLITNYYNLNFSKIITSKEFMNMINYSLSESDFKDYEYDFSSVKWKMDFNDNTFGFKKVYNKGIKNKIKYFWRKYIIKNIK